MGLGGKLLQKVMENSTSYSGQQEGSGGVIAPSEPHAFGLLDLAINRYYCRQINISEEVKEK